MLSACAVKMQALKLPKQGFHINSNSLNIALRDYIIRAQKNIYDDCTDLTSGRSCLSEYLHTPIQFKHALPRWATILLLVPDSVTPPLHRPIPCIYLHRKEEFRTGKLANQRITNGVE